MGVKIMALLDVENDDIFTEEFRPFPPIEAYEQETFNDADAVPFDLWNNFAPPHLPKGLLPPVIESFGVIQGKSMGADKSGLVMSALAVCSAAITDSIKLQVKRHDASWRESARIWVALIGMPSTKKSPIIGAAAKPLIGIDHNLASDYARRMAEYNDLTKDEKREVEKPKQVRVRLEDTTMEAAQEVLKDSPDGLLCLQDEMSGWFGSMDKYSGKGGSAKDRGFWLQSFNGGQSAVNRVARGSFVIPNLSVSMLGGIQPEVIRNLAAESHDDGLLQRLFPIVLSPATLGLDEPMTDVAKRYSDLIHKLHTLTAKQIGDYGPGATGEGILKFDDDAQAIRKELENKHLNLQALEMINPKLAAHIGKLDGLFARLCIIWHCIENIHSMIIPDIISGSIAIRVAKFIHQFLLPHAVSFFAGILGLSQENDRLVAVAGYILARQTEEVTRRDIQRGDRIMRAMDRFEIDKVMQQLESLGWLIAHEKGKWTVNPRCHQLYAEKAIEEHDRRVKAREMITHIVKGGDNGDK
jgi:Protein of unknown function (DUF3987)